MKLVSVAVVVTQCTWEQLVCWWCWWGGRVYFRGPRTPPSRFSCPASVNCLLNTILESHAFFHHPALYCFIKSQPHTLRHTFFQSFLFCRISSLITANSELPSIKQIWIQIMKDWNCSPSLAKWCCVMLLLIRKILITQECKAGYSRGQSSTKQLLTVSSLSS